MRRARCSKGGAMAELQLAQVGCGGMGLRHLYGLIELKQQGFDTFDLTALCDLHLEAAQHVAGVAEQGLGTRPRIYTSYDEMLAKERGLDAVNVVTDTRVHHKFALKAFEAGLHVAVEKPMALTVRACRRMIDGARRADRVLSISENYRRDPVNRLIRALLDAKAVGDPRLILHTALGGGRMVQQMAAWRHTKLRGGYVLEYGVHDADLFLFFMGDVERVYAETHLWERKRYTGDAPLVGHLRQFYGHRVKEVEERGEAVECTAEDMALADIRFRSGAAGQLSMSIAMAGAPTHASMLYCSEGSLALPGSRSGRPVVVTPSGAQGPLPESETLALAPRFQLDEATARFFGGQRRLSSYQVPFEQVDRKLVAIELQDFANAVLNGTDPEVPGEAGLKAVALCYAILESGHAGRAVSFADVVEDRVNTYQAEINESVGL